MVTKKAVCEVILETLLDVAIDPAAWSVSAIYAELKQKVLELPEEQEEKDEHKRR